MPEQDYIKYAYEKKEMSIAEIARRQGICWRTARKYANQEDWSQAERQPRRQPSMEAFAETVDTWLMEDRLNPRKQRRNAAAIYRQLRDEHGFKGSDRTVRSYVARRKVELFREEKTPYIQLDHPAGEAQVDFGTVTVVHEDVLKEVQLLLLTFPFSNAGFAYPMPAQNQECFLEALKRLFIMTGGVPQRVRFDNLSAAVAHVGKGEERTLTEVFRRFKLHYRFEAEFCGPACGNEKGNVENKVGYSRRQWMNPMKAMESFAGLAAELHEQALSDMQRAHYQKGDTIADLWSRERSSLMALPTVAFDVVCLDAAVLNNYSQFKWDGATYDVPKGKPQQKILIKAYWDRVEVLDSQQQQLATLSRHYMMKTHAIDWAAHFENYARRPRATVNAAMFRHMPEVVQDFLKHAESDARASRVRLLRDMLKNHSMQAVAQALEAIPPDGRDDRTSLELKLYAQHPDHALPAPLDDQYTPSEVVGYEPDNSIYDQLSPTGRKEEEHEHQAA